MKLFDRIATLLGISTYERAPTSAVSLDDANIQTAREALGAKLTIARGIMPVGQPEDATAASEASLEKHDPFTLAAAHVMTTLMGSALLALAHLHGRLSAEAAWAAATFSGFPSQVLSAGACSARP